MNERMSTKPPTRLFHLDSLRVLLTFLVVVHHVAGSYGGDGNGGWGVVDPAVDTISQIGLTFCFPHQGILHVRSSCDWRVFYGLLI